MELLIKLKYLDTSFPHVFKWNTRCRNYLTISLIYLRHFMTGVTQSVQGLSYGLDDRGSNPGTSNEVIFSVFATASIPAQ